jgi:hypothetical protein
MFCVVTVLMDRTDGRDHHDSEQQDEACPDARDASLCLFRW